MRFPFIAKHRGIWPVAWLCEALDVSRSGFHAWLIRAPSKRSRDDEEIGAKVRESFAGSARTYGARRVWRDVLAAGIDCGLHRIERLMRTQALRARPGRVQTVSELNLGSTAAQGLIRERWRKHPRCADLEQQSCVAAIMSQKLITPARIAADPQFRPIHSSFKSNVMR
jgi:HTH-like domain